LFLYEIKQKTHIFSSENAPSHKLYNFSPKSSQIYPNKIPFYSFVILLKRFGLIYKLHYRLS